ncbi:class I tRNA ligase family protein [Candidatus Saccharibacteria bacterium]|nr:class I tRNA ligase family protein [Candidatus Saccharibacteria bacterium]
MKRYSPADIEPKWQKKWTESRIYAAEDFSDKPKFVMLTEFPYPSGAGLHMGHLREYTLGDIIARYKRANGYNVLFPMGYDAFGLPTENYAIKNKISPQIATDQNTAVFRRQLDMMGYSIDWQRSFATSDPDYYRWTQWMFLQFFEKGLAYRDEIAINWCPFCKTGLANEEVVNGRHERCDNLVEKKMLKQWMLRITDYAERLIDGLADVDYPPRIADQQINWIGKSVGAEIDFVIASENPPVIANKTSSVIASKQSMDRHGDKSPRDDKITVFTTRPDTIFGATFMVLAPEHPLVAEITTAEQKVEVETYVRAAQAKSEIERQETDRAKTGTFTGAYAINPANNEKIPIWIADYVLMGYGTGAIMAVPAHDERDWEFAKKYNIPIVAVIARDFGEKLENSKQVEGVVVIGYDPTTKKFMRLTNNNVKSGWLVSGGRDENETFEEAARRELAEEAGYVKIEKLIELGVPVYSYYYNDNKRSNRRSLSHNFLAILDSSQTTSQNQETHEDFSIIWDDFDEIYKNVETTEGGVEHWLHALKQAKVAVKNYEKNEEFTPEMFAGEGIMINSGEFDGQDSTEAGKAIVEWLAKKDAARAKTQYKLRDWVYSRQHYWGEPIPIIHCEKHGAVAVPDDELPVELPPVDHYEPTDDGHSPLSKIDSWVNTTCPKCGEPAKRETDTMPNWAGSNWYYLRYYDAKNDKAFASPEKLKYWGMADLYLGGMEHTTLHLLYSRFHHQFLYDQGLVPTPEPYAARRGQGIVLAADGRKMSKSLNNVVDPTPIIESGYGADAARLGVTFLAPYDQTTPWSPEAVAGCYRFLGRVWNLACDVIASDAKQSMDRHDDKSPRDDVLRILHQTIKKVSDDLERMNFNTAIAALMEALNGFSKDAAEVDREMMSVFVQLLAPFAPHIAAELYEELGNTEPIEKAGWPTWDEKYLIEETMTIAVQVNGKLRGEITVAADASEDEIKTAAVAVENVHSFIGNKKPTRVIYVPGRVVNVVI